MASSKWKTWDELAALTSDRPVVFWGCSNWIERSLEFFNPNVLCIVDNNPYNQGIEFAGFPVKPPAALREEAYRAAYVVITTANYPSVVDELHAMGRIMGDGFCCTPLLNEHAVREAIKSLDKAVLLSSPQHFSDTTSGGGLYLVRTINGETTKVYSGKCRGLARAGDGYLVLDMLHGLVVLDAAFKQTGLIALQENSEPHGICHDPASDRVFIAQPGRDSIAVYDLTTGKRLEEFFISDKWRSNGKDNHHLNDLCFHGGSLFVSLFSISGNWMNEAYDGGVLEIDASSGKVVGAVVQDLWMPHSVQRFDGKLVYADSMRGELRTMNWARIASFNGYIRGLDFDGSYYYVGVTEHRYPEKLRGMSENISLDNGFHILDPNSKLTRFFPLANAESVHSLIVLADDAAPRG